MISQVTSRYCELKGLNRHLFHIAASSGVYRANSAATHLLRVCEKLSKTSMRFGKNTPATWTSTAEAIKEAWPSGSILTGVQDQRSTWSLKTATQTCFGICKWQRLQQKNRIYEVKVKWTNMGGKRKYNYRPSIWITNVPSTERCAKIISA